MGVGLIVGTGVGVSVGVGVGVSVGVGEAVGDGDGVGETVGEGVGVGVASGVEEACVDPSADGGVVDEIISEGVELVVSGVVVPTESSDGVLVLVPRIWPTGGVTTKVVGGVVEAIISCMADVLPSLTVNLALGEAKECQLNVKLYGAFWLRLMVKPLASTSLTLLKIGVGSPSKLITTTGW